MQIQSTVVVCVLMSLQFICSGCSALCYLSLSAAQLWEMFTASFAKYDFLDLRTSLLIYFVTLLCDLHSPTWSTNCFIAWYAVQHCCIKGSGLIKQSLLQQHPDIICLANWLEVLYYNIQPALSLYLITQCSPRMSLSSAPPKDLHEWVLLTTISLFTWWTLSRLGLSVLCFFKI